MKKYRIIARQRIIDPKTKRVHDDFGLMALNGYYEDIIEMNEPIDEIMFHLQFEQDLPEYKGWNLQIIEIE